MSTYFCLVLNNSARCDDPIRLNTRMQGCLLAMTSKCATQEFVSVNVPFISHSALTGRQSITVGYDAD